MRKIPTLFYFTDFEVRTRTGPRLIGRCINEVRSGCEWVLAGQGVATKKLDGSACLYLFDREQGARLFKRFTLRFQEVPAGQGSFQHQGRDYRPLTMHLPPAGFLKAQPEPILSADGKSGEWPGWVPVTNDPADARHREGLVNSLPLTPGTYELCGPRINGNPEGLTKHMLLPHGKDILPDCPRTFKELKHYLRDLDIEGVVFWSEPGNPNAPAAKIRKKDFGLPRKPKASKILAVSNA